MNNRLSCCVIRALSCGGILIWGLRLRADVITNVVRVLWFCSKTSVLKEFNESSGNQCSI